MLKCWMIVVAMIEMCKSLGGKLIGGIGPGISLLIPNKSTSDHTCSSCFDICCVFISKSMFGCTVACFNNVYWLQNLSRAVHVLRFAIYLSTVLEMPSKFIWCYEKHKLTLVLFVIVWMLVKRLRCITVLIHHLSSKSLTSASTNCNFQCHNYYLGKVSKK